MNIPWRFPWYSKKRCEPRYKLSVAIQQLERKIAREDDEMGDVSNKFFREGGICCPACGVPGHSKRMMKQERREQWLKILRAKQSLAVRG